MYRSLLLALGMLCSFVAHAEMPTDPLAWLGRIASAAQRLNYVGTFSYQTGKRIETSRIMHVVDAQGEYERLEVLDGSPREVIRSNGEVRCLLPDQRTVIIDRPGDRRAFPARLPASIGVLAENYRIRKGEIGRVAGHEAQQIVLEPKDDLRFGHVLWADAASGLLLKARMVDERGETVEQFVFNDVQIGVELTRERAASRQTVANDWKIVQAGGSPLREDEFPWALRTGLPGFQQSSLMRRQLGRGHVEAVHIVYSDGISTVSAFIEPISADIHSAAGEFSSGATNIYKRQLDGHLITVLGEVPQRTLRRLGDAIERKVN